MKTLTINLLDDSAGEVWLFDRETKTNMCLGKRSYEDFEKLSDVLKKDEKIICNRLGTGISYKNSELEAITTEELKLICDTLNAKLKERDN